VPDMSSCKGSTVSLPHAVYLLSDGRWTDHPVVDGVRYVPFAEAERLSVENQMLTRMNATLKKQVERWHSGYNAKDMECLFLQHELDRLKGKE
jgi:hypothetical protein